MSDPNYQPFTGHVTSAATEQPNNDEPALPSHMVDSIAQVMAMVTSVPTSTPPVTNGAPVNGVRYITDDYETMQTLIHAYKIKSAAPTTEPILILGPSGTGKELLARIIHGGDPDVPFVSINVAALTDTLVHSTLFGHMKGSFTGAAADFPGAFRAARSGMIFLDEIGDMPRHQQSALLRVLAERVVTPIGTVAQFAVHCRIVAATNADVTDDAIMRHDLYSRFMHVLTLRSLADRQADASLIAAYYGLSEKGLADIPSQSLARYNVRAIQRAAARERLLS